MHKPISNNTLTHDQGQYQVKIKQMNQRTNAYVQFTIRIGSPMANHGFLFTIKSPSRFQLDAVENS